MKTTFTLITASAIALSALGLPALAGGMTEPAAEPQVFVDPAPAVVPSADWTGGYVGAQIGYGDIDSNGAGLDGNGAIGGIHAGYRLDYGQFVAGAELQYDTTNIELGTGGDTLDNVARLKLIGGADLGKTFLYGTAGVARASATIGGSGVSDNGYFLGVGADYALGNQWTVGAEVLTHRFDDFGGTGTDLDATTVQAKLGYRF